VRRRDGAEDIPVNIDSSINVPVDVEGGMVIVKAISKPGDFVDLRCEEDRIMITSNCPQERNLPRR